MALAGGGTAPQCSDSISMLGGPDAAGFNIHVKQGRRLPKNEFGCDFDRYEWTLALEGFEAGQYIYFYQNEDCLSGLGKRFSSHQITKEHAQGHVMVIQELASDTSAFDASKLEEYHFRYQGLYNTTCFDLHACGLVLLSFE